ncbi:MoxR-like ATPase [Gaertneriomyces sp. JEL0708]|nr:MoxR-like ATPase [Gaertneriomyces sp. JEL0708]
MRSFLHKNLDLLRPLLATASTAIPSRGPPSTGYLTVTDPGSFVETEELFTSILITLAAGHQALLVSCSSDTIKDLRNALEQLLLLAFGFAVTSVHLAHPTSSSEFLSSIFHCTKAPDFYHANHSTSGSTTSLPRRRPGAPSKTEVDENDSSHARQSSGHHRYASDRAEGGSSARSISAASAKYVPSPSTSEGELLPLPIGLPLRLHRDRGHSHSRTAATVGSRPVMFAQQSVIGDSASASSISSLLASKYLPNVILVEGLMDANAAVHKFLLEMLDKRQVIDKGTVYPLPTIFLVVSISRASHHDCNLPLSLLDRFFLCHHIATPVVNIGNNNVPVKEALIEANEIAILSSGIENIMVHADVARYSRDLMMAIRNHPLTATGVSPRSGADLVLAAQALALLSNSCAVTPDHIALMADKIIGHRLIIATQSPYVSTRTRRKLHGVRGIDVVLDVLHALPVPV